MTQHKSKIKILVLSVLLFSGCTKLDEETFGSLSPDNYYRTEKEALSSVAGVYSLLSQVVHIGDPWRVSEFGTDEFLVPGRASGGWFDQSQIDIIQHNANPDNGRTATAWINIFQEIGTANAVLQSLETSPNSSNLKPLIAETRALRAYGYFYAMDLWGNVPIVTTARIDPANLPKTNTRKEVYDFVTTEMLKAVDDLPSVKSVAKTSYYPRFTKEAVYAALATVYLNAEVYAGTAAYDKSLDMCNKIIATGAYKLEVDVADNFKSTNEDKSTEIISSFSVDPNKNAGGNQFILYTQHALDQKKYNLPFIPADGYSTTPEALSRYEDQDNRKKLIEYGAQYYLDGSPMLLPNGQQLVLVPVKDLVGAEDNEGYKVLKYTPTGAKFVGFNGDNDLVLIRYADVLLMKAEALFRAGNSTEALTLVNQIRSRSNATALTAITLKDIENERAREFIWEGGRRRDMIRFGTYFTGTWKFKTGQTPVWRGIYPIPSQQLNANPNLKQNTGY